MFRLMDLSFLFICYFRIINSYMGVMLPRICAATISNAFYS
jgi:hypothetical protein